MKRILAPCLLFVGAALLPVTTSAAQKTKSTHAAMQLAPSDSAPASGVRIRQFSTIRADVLLTDDGTTLNVKGVGVGFNATLAYTSFFYGTGSVQNGSLACIPPTPNNLTATQMITAYWLPVGSTRRTLTVVKTGASYAPLSAIATMSVRYDSTPTLPLTTNLNPGRFWLNSCGLVKPLGSRDDSR